MKKIVVFLSLFLSLGLIVQAQVKLERNTAGEYRVEVANKNWSPTNIVADSATLRYMAFFDEAISPHPKPVLVYKNEKVIKLKPVFKKLVEIESDRIIYNQTTKKISLLVDKRREVKSSYLILFALMSIMSVIFINFFSFFKKDNSMNTPLALPDAIALTTVSGAFVKVLFVDANICALICSFFAVLIVLIIILISEEIPVRNNIDRYIDTILFILFYILMTVYIVSLYI